MLKRLLIVSLLSGLWLQSHAQSADSTQTADLPLGDPYYKHSFGLHLGPVSGYGLSYRNRPEKGLGVQVTYLPIFVLDKENRDDGSIHSLSFSLLHTFSQGEKSNFYLYQANSLWFLAMSDNRNGSNEAVLNHSVGLGMEINIQDRGGFNLQAGIGGYNSFELILPDGAISIYYKF